jgi:hypothetical protein
MDDSKQLCSIWQRHLDGFRSVFTEPGFKLFSQWTTATVFCDEEHTITQELGAMGWSDDWRNFEHFAEYGAFDLRTVERAGMQLIEQQHPCRFGRYHPAAVDDTKELRSSQHVWGVCTFKHVSSRNPKHPKLVMAHNWVVMGDLAPPNQTGGVWTYLPTAARLYMRRGQLPRGERFATKLEQAAEMLKQLDSVSAAPVLGIFDGGYARAKVIGPCLTSDRRIEILTRPRSDARLYAPLPVDNPRTRSRAGRPRKWGKRLAAPQDHQQWQVPWKSGKGWAYGKQRRFRCKSMICRWAVSGAEQPVRAFVFEVKGYAKPWYLITSALDLSASQVLEAYAARFRQEDSIRDHKQRMGMEEVRAWTKAPVLRTFQVQQTSLTLLRLLQWELERRGKDWYVPPPWNRNKQRASILDLRRLLWRYRNRFSKFMQQTAELRKTG